VAVASARRSASTPVDGEPARPEAQSAVAVPRPSMRMFGVKTASLPEAVNSAIGACHSPPCCGAADAVATSSSGNAARSNRRTILRPYDSRVTKESKPVHRTPWSGVARARRQVIDPAALGSQVAVERGLSRISVARRKNAIGDGAREDHHANSALSQLDEVAIRVKRSPRSRQLQ